LWLLHFGGSVFNATGYDRYIPIFAQSQEYRGWDNIKCLLGGAYTIGFLWREVRSINLFKQAPEMKVPVYFCVGRHDYHTPMN
jgi:hypothetical protein